VRVVLADGSVLEGELPYQKGGPENPWSAADVRGKFRGNASLALAEADVDALEHAVLTLEEQADLPAALAPIARQAVAA
jgi:hypothetical protein